MTQPLTIREYVQLQLPETYDTIVQIGNYDGSTKPDLVGAAIDSRMDLLFVDGTTESALGAFTRSYVAGVVTLALLSAYIDYAMWQTRRSDSMSRPPGMEPGGGESSQNYDRVQALQQVGTMIARRLDRDRDDFVALNETILRRTGARKYTAARISTDPGALNVGVLKTPDAADVFPGILDPGWLPNDPFVGSAAGAFGVPAILVPEQFQPTP